MRGVGANQPSARMQAVALRDVRAPCGRDRTALESTGQECRNSPSDDHGDEYVDEASKGLVDSENAQVEAQDR